MVLGRFIVPAKANHTFKYKQIGGGLFADTVYT